MQHKIKIIILLLVSLIFIVISAVAGYKMGEHSAVLQVKAAAPTQLARAMQSDEFYSDYPDRMLLVTGAVASVQTKNKNTLVRFTLQTSGHTVLPDVFCNFGGKENTVTSGSTITILTVASAARRQGVSDVFLQNCYLLSVHPKL